MSKMEKGTETIPVVAGKARKEVALRSPNATFEELRNEFEDLWLRPWRGLRSFPRLSDLSPRTQGWMPSTDVFQKNGTLIVKADLPGLAKEDVKVSLDDGDLVLEGERRQESKVEEKDFVRSECSYGSFYRRVPLPEGVDASKIHAKVNDGVLEVRVPMPQSTAKAAHKIEVR